LNKNGGLNLNFITVEDGDNVSGDAEDLDDNDAKAEYVKKEYVARPYECLTGVLEEVEKCIIKDSRPKLHMRISRARREFGQDGFTLADKEAGELSQDLKAQIRGISYANTSKHVLDMGLQAAYQMK
jgi:hypothetical protein